VAHCTRMGELDRSATALFVEDVRERVYLPGQAGHLAGKIYGCAVYLPRTEACIAVDLLVRAVNGERVQGRSIDPLTLSPIGPIGTKSNIARFKPEFHS
jgi:hypothetical protein